MIENTQPDLAKLPGGFVPDPVTIPDLSGSVPFVEEINGLNGEAFVIHNALSPQDCETLISFFADAPISAPVSVAGFNESMSSANTMGVAGSMRTTMWAPDLAEKVWNQIKMFFGPRYMEDTTSTDWWQAKLPEGAFAWEDGHHRHWAAVGASPMMRFMKYEDGGEHYAHYDAGYFYPDGEHRTLMSFVMYLTTNTEGGATRFIKDAQSDLPVWERSHDDWDRQVHDEEVIKAVQPLEGSILVFDHRLCHDVQPYLGENPRIIVRGDIIYKRYDRY